MFFTAIVSWIVIAGLVWTSYSTYRDFKEEYMQDVKKSAVEIQQVFDEKVVLIEHFLQFIGAQIRNYKTTDPSKIASIIRYNTSANLDDTITWNIIDYVTPKGDLVADSVKGSRTPTHVLGKRSWMKYSMHEPWKMHFSKPSIGLVTGDNILPGGISIYSDDGGKNLGYLASGISIEKLKSSMVNVMNENISFVILDRDLNIIMISDPFIREDDLSHSLSKYKENILTVSTTPSELDQYIKSKDSVFSYYIHSSRFPFMVLAGFDQSHYSREFWRDILPKLATNITLWLLFSGILAYLSHQVVKPIIALGKAARDISDGKEVNLPEFRSKDLNILGSQLENISKIQSNLKQKQVSLSRTNKELINANEFINTNMSFLSHELINPTQSIVSFSKLLSDDISDKVSPASKEYLDIINKSSAHLNKQLKFFLRLFKFQAEKRAIEEKPIILKELVEWNLSMIAHHLKKKRVKVKCTVDENIALIGDEIMIGQLIQNIASNGAKYNKVEGYLDISTRINKKGEIQVIFSDTGIGIDKRELNKIFKLFKRAKNGRNSKTVGYGIGLSYAKNCVDAHGGHIEVKSKLGEGTKFIITFPKNRTYKTSGIKA